MKGMAIKGQGAPVGGRSRSSMNTARLNSRLKKLERVLCPLDDGTFTLEELCRAMWHNSKRDFLKLAQGASVGFFIAQFEREDAERSQSARRPGETPGRR